MADSGTALRASDLVLTLVQSGGIAGQEKTATLRLSDLPRADADRARELVRRVLTEAPPAPAEPAVAYDACEYELTVSAAGVADRRIVTRDGSLTPAQRELIGLLRPRLSPVRP